MNNSGTFSMRQADQADKTCSFVDAIHRKAAGEFSDDTALYTPFVFVIYIIHKGWWLYLLWSPLTGLHKTSLLVTSLLSSTSIRDFEAKLDTVILDTLNNL